MNLPKKLTILKVLFFPFLFLMIGSWSQAGPKKNRGTATFFIMLDQSSSMIQHGEKVTDIALILQNALEQSYCNIKVGVGNIQYDTFMADIYLKPWGYPYFVGVENPKLPEIIRDRILNPYKANNVDDENGNPHPAKGKYIPNLGGELTYSSLVNSIRVNLPEIAGSNILGTLLVTDAAPAYELHSPRQAYDEIQSLLGSTLFASAIVGPELSSGIVPQTGPVSVEEIIAVEENRHPPLACSPDFPGYQRPGEAISVSTWASKNHRAIDEFTAITYENMQWDICKNNYELELTQFIQRVLSLGDCISIM